MKESMMTPELTKISTARQGIGSDFPRSRQGPSGHGWNTHRILDSRPHGATGELIDPLPDPGVGLSDSRTGTRSGRLFTTPGMLPWFDARTLYPSDSPASPP